MLTRKMNPLGDALRQRVFLFSLVLLVAMVTSAVSREIYVDPGPGTIEAVVAEPTTVDGDVLVLRPGTYTGHWGEWDEVSPIQESWHPPINPQGKNITFRSEVPYEANIYGVTSICPYYGGPGDMGYIFYYSSCVFENGETQDCRLEDLTIMCGVNQESLGENTALRGVFRAFAICCNISSTPPTIRSSPTIKNCKIIGGDAAPDYWGGMNWGGIYCKNSDAVIENCIISRNNIGVGWSGGPPSNAHPAVYIEGDSNIKIKGCQIINNTSYNSSDPSMVLLEGTAIFSHTPVGDEYYDKDLQEYIPYQHSRGPNLMIENSTISENEGCGIYAWTGYLDTDLTISNCTIEGNGQGNVLREGLTTGDVTISKSTIDGGHIAPGLYLFNSGEIEITGCTIKDCCSSSEGAGIWIADYDTNVLIDDCTLTGNTCDSDGSAIYLYECASGTINECTISGNESGYRGGGIYIRNAQNVTISNCEISDNKSGMMTPGNGGGIYNAATGTTVTHCTITGNHAYNPDGKKNRGGGGGIYSSRDINIINCMITGNEADGNPYDGGGGICIGYWLSNCPKSKIINSTIAGNEVFDGGGGGAYFGGSYAYSPNVDITNCIFWGNHPEQQIKGWGEVINISHCDIQHSKSVPYDLGWGTKDYIVDLNFDPDSPDDHYILGNDLGGNLPPDEDRNPNFTTDYHLNRGSPCIDAGDNSVATWPFDIDWDNRIIEGTVDMGADEVNYLVSWWKFDEGNGNIAYDSAGDNNGTLVNGPIWTTGQINGALSFDGTNDYVTVGSPASLDDLPLNNMTVCAWIYDKNTSGTKWGTVAGCYAYNNGWSFRTFSNSGGDRSLCFQVPHSGGQYSKWATSWSSDGTIIPNTWHHVVAVWDGSTKTAKLYIDGAEPSYQTTNPGVGAYNSDASRNKEIGRIPHVGGIQYFNGVIDDVRIYDRALPAEEIWQLYRSGLGPKAFNPIPADGKTDVNPNTVLSWSPGKDAASHDVYLGTDFDAVNNADHSDPEFKGPQSSTTYDPPDILDFETTYYWRIDEVNSAHPDKLWKGDVWSFTTWADPNSYLVSWWKLDEGSGSTAYDSAGDNNGTLVNGPIWTTGQINGALSFDGTNDYVTVGSPASLDDLPLGNFTVSAWIYDEHTAGTTWGTIYGSEAQGYGWSFRTFSNADGDRSLHFQALHSTTYARCWSSDGTILQNAWHHVAAVWDANTKTAKLYIDGNEPSYQTAIAGAGTYKSDASRNKEIGRMPHAGGVQYFNGVIDDVRIYDRALSAEEIEYLYQEGL